MTAQTQKLSFSANRQGASAFFPATRFTYAFAIGIGWGVVSRPGQVLPNIQVFRIGTRPFARMWHLRRPFNVIRVGEWCRP